MADRAELLASVCSLWSKGNSTAARESLIERYPYATGSTRRNSWPRHRLLAVFVRDQFTDQYFGTRLVFPGTLLALSLLIPDAFPYQRHWKQSQTHPAFWELSPTIDHIVPVARGGADDESNVVTTSMLTNSAKSNWLLEELGWSKERAKPVPGWDGLLTWFMSEWDRDPRLQQETTLRSWYQAAVAVSATNVVGGIQTQATKEI